MTPARGRADSETGADTKVCSHCRNEWPPDCFSPNQRNSDGLQSWCKPCVNERVQQRHAALLATDPEAFRASQRDAVRRYRAKHGNERGLAMDAARREALRRLVSAHAAEFEAAYDAVLLERGLEPRR